MTTPEIPDKAIEAASAAYMATPRCRCIQTPQDKKQMRAALEAAMPHLRAAWEQPIRELCEGSLAKASDPLASRMFNGSPFPAKVCAKDVLALLEGGGE